VAADDDHASVSDRRKAAWLAASGVVFVLVIAIILG